MNCLALPAQGMSAGGGRRSTAETTKRQANVRPAAARMFRDGPSVAGRSQAPLPRHKAVLQDLHRQPKAGCVMTMPGRACYTGNADGEVSHGIRNMRSLWPLPEARSQP